MGQILFFFNDSRMIKAEGKGKRGRREQVYSAMAMSGTRCTSGATEQRACFDIIMIVIVVGQSQSRRSAGM